MNISAPVIKKCILIPLIALSASMSSAALIIYHEFETETAGVFTDTAGNYDGTGGQLDTVTTKIGSGSGSFGGDADQIDLGVTDSDLTGISGFTLSTWIRPTSIASGRRYIFGNTEENKASIMFMIDGSELTLGLYSGGTWNGNPDNNNSPGAGIAANTWTHVALVWDGDYATFYVDGATQAGWTHNLADGTIDRQGNAPTPTAVIGANHVSGSSFLGNIDDFAIWDEALTSTQIEGLADESLTPLTVIPEPSAIFLALGGLLTTLLFSRRRSCK